MNTTSVPTIIATIYVGTYDKKNNSFLSLSDINKICQEYVDKVGLCVTVTETKFHYTNGNEPGAAIGFINYPRFPSEIDEIKNQALELAQLLKDGMHQERVSVVFSNETIMIGVK